MPKKTKCAGTNKAGKPCRAWPVKGEKFCMGHLDRKKKEELGFGGAQEGSGRPKNPRVIDVLKVRLEERADEIIDVYLEAARATTHERVGRKLIEVPDHAMRLRAVEALHDRAYGKPKQVSEITGPEGGPIAHVGIPDEDDFHKQTAAVLAEAEAIKADA
jgi:hypothetical protein